MPPEKRGLISKISGAPVAGKNGKILGIVSEADMDTCVKWGIGYKLAVIGGYHPVGQFLSNVGSLNRIVAPVALDLKQGSPAEKKKAPAVVKPGKRVQPRRGSDWNRNFDLQKAPKIWQAAQESGCRQGDR